MLGIFKGALKLNPNTVAHRHGDVIEWPCMGCKQRVRQRVREIFLQDRNRGGLDTAVGVHCPGCGARWLQGYRDEGTEPAVLLREEG